MKKNICYIFVVYVFQFYEALSDCQLQEQMPA